MTVRDQIALIVSNPRLREDREAQQLLAKLTELVESNPLATFEPHSEPQSTFITSRTRVVAAFAGNQFGKSTVLTVCALREVLPEELLPPWLAATRRYRPPTHGWIMVPSEDKIYDSFQPAFEEWCPKQGFQKGSWGRAFNGTRLQLTMSTGSTITFKTYKQDPSTLGGARLHWIGYDEPPPKKHREEGRMRLVRYGGHEMFAMTPLDANTQYVRKAIWKQREHPDITVVRGSIHDNPTLDKETVAATLGDLSDIWRQAREFGDFVDLGGQIYPEFERCVLADPLLPSFVRTLDVVVGIDPGIRNAGFVWVGFDRDNQCFVFNEGLLQNTEAKGYAEFIKAENRRLGLHNVQYVTDPAARSRGQVNAETVMMALSREGIYANAGQNDHQTGFDQMRSRMANGRFHVDPRCVGLRDEADDYSAKEPGENDDNSHLEPQSNQFHRLDALRYAVMERLYDPIQEQQDAERGLGVHVDRNGQIAVDNPSKWLVVPEPVGPMGAMS
jgi:phage terminase large subunit-like protein